MSTYRQIQETFNQLNRVLINPEGYCEKSKTLTPFMNLFCQVMNIIHCVNDNDNNFVKYYTSSLLDTLQSKNVSLVGKKMSTNLGNFCLIYFAIVGYYS